MTLTLIEATSTSLTVSWTETTKAKRYILQYRPVTCSDKEHEYTTLSDKLTSTQARKRNLSDVHNTGFMFRAGAIMNGENNDDDVALPTRWETHSEPFHLLDAKEEKDQLEAPTVSLAGSYETLLISWQNNNKPPSDNNLKYELQMRENQGGSTWNTIAPSLSSTQVKKKHLTFSHGYQFRVRPVSDNNNNNLPFSPPSDAMVALGLSPGIQRWFSQAKLLPNAKSAPVSLTEALGGKEFILLYASAHWCGPCRQFTPQLAKWYHSLGANSTVQVVFLSADHDEAGFQSYFGTMPWVAVEYEDDMRERLMAQISVSGIPRLAVLDGRTGRMVEENAVGKSLDVDRWRTMAKNPK